MTAADEPIHEGSGAWGRGDLDALAAVLDPAVTLRAMRPGPWDCDNRDQVMGLLRHREAGRNGRPPDEVELRQVDVATFIVSGLDSGEGSPPASSFPVAK